MWWVWRCVAAQTCVACRALPFRPPGPSSARPPYALCMHDLTLLLHTRCRVTSQQCSVAAHAAVWCRFIFSGIVSLHFSAV
eukprot:357567-Chlamydomonas_euryale.AAC.2